MPMTRVPTMSRLVAQLEHAHRLGRDQGDATLFVDREQPRAERAQQPARELFVIRCHAPLSEERESGWSEALRIRLRHVVTLAFLA